MYNYVNFGCFYARFEEKDHVFTIGHEKYGEILTKCKLLAYTGHVEDMFSHKKVKTEDFQMVVCGHEKHLDGRGLSVCFSGGPEELAHMALRITLHKDDVIVSVDAVKDTRFFYTFSGYALWGKAPETDTFAVYTKEVEKGLRCAVGPAAGRGCDALFDRQTDSMLTLTGSPRYHYDYEEGAYHFSVKLKNEEMSFRLAIDEGVMTEKFGLRQYTPMSQETVFQRPPVGWMTWYAVKFEACEEAVLANARIQRDKLKAYGADAIWVDWEWYHTSFEEIEKSGDTFHPNEKLYPNGLKYVADGIRKEGFTPCVWIAATHDVCENEFLQEYPETLLARRRAWCGEWWFDPTHPRYLNEFIPRVFRQLTEEWGYDVIKWDALPRSLDFYDQYHDQLYDPSLTSEEALRAVEQKAREVIGDKVYMLTCHGEGDRDVTMSTDIFDAVRIGADVFNWSEFLTAGVGRLYRFYPLHNVVAHCDPDNLLVREEFNTLDQAISRVSLYALLGTPITLGDDLRELPEERFDLIRKGIPPMITHPMILEKREPKEECELINTFIRTRYDEYQVVDIFNLSKRAISYTLQFNDLDLEEDTEYLVYDFWNQEYLGKFRHSMILTLRACQARVFAVRKCLGRPQLLSTNRHITQGAFEIQEIKWSEETKTLSGISETIPGEEYVITAYDPETDKIVETSLIPKENRTEWALHFA